MLEDLMNEVNSNSTLNLEQRLSAIIFSQRKAIQVTVYSSIAILILSIMVFLLLFTHHTEQKYFATTADGRLFRLTPINEPIESDQAVEAFAARTITDTFTFDYINYKKTITVLGDRYSSDAFTQIKNSLQKNGGIVSEAIKNKWIVTATLISNPQLIQKGIVPDTNKFGWRMRVPLIITYQSEDKTLSAKYFADVTVIRVDQKNNPRGIEIANMQLNLVS